MTDRFREFDVDPITLARRLLGQRLVRRLHGRRLSGTIVEVEAYLGAVDRAAHAFGGRRTDRNASMYEEGGHAYVYFIYGLHHCLNVVCGRADEPVAVLLRALAPEEGREEMYRRRPAARRDEDLTSGPARLTQAMGIDRSLDGSDFRTDDDLRIERVRRRALPGRLIGSSPRIGVAYAGEWALEPLRFFVKGSPHLSRASK